MTFWLAALAAAAQSAGGAPVAPGPTPAPVPVATPEARDARCLAAFAFLAGQAGPAAQAGRTGTMFFYGKLVGRDPAINLAGVMRAAAREIAATVRPELIRCSGELQAAGQAMTAAGGTLKGGGAPN